MRRAMLNARRIPLARGKLHRGHPPITTNPMGGDVCGGLPLLTKNDSGGGGGGVSNMTSYNYFQVMNLILKQKLPRHRCVFLAKIIVVQSCCCSQKVIKKLILDILDLKNMT